MKEQSYYSNIYWHFTGSPVIGDTEGIECPEDMLLNNRKPKENEKAIDIMLEILRTRKFLATSKEQLHKGYETENFCCLTDIPLNNLHVHRK